MKIPFKLTAAVDIESRRANMLSALARGLPKLGAAEIREGESLTLAAYGPSLRDTYREMKHPIMGMSGSSKWLYEHGVKVDFHLDMDPRPHKVSMITPPVPGVLYLLASVCAPNYFDTMKDERILLWHAVSSNEHDDLAWLSQHDPGALLVTTGSNAGLAAFQIGGLLGYRHFEVHGLDGSFEGREVHHAGVHTGKTQVATQKWMVGGKPYYSSKVLMNGAAEVINNIKSYPLFAVFHGEGLTQALVEEANLPNACRDYQTEKAERVRRMRAEFVEIPPINKKKCVRWSPWEPLCLASMDPYWVEELQEKFEGLEKLRTRARYNTGSISLETGLLLRAICNWKQPKNIIEIGTFIGKSTAAMWAHDRIYTCDRNNDCLKGTEKVVVHPYQSSTQMLRKLVSEGVKADMFFFDGRLAPEDIPLVLSIAAPGAVYAFDDWYDGPTGKGKANTAMLLPWLSRYGLVPPYEGFAGRTSLALLVPTTLESSAP